MSESTSADGRSARPAPRTATADTDDEDLSAYLPQDRRRALAQGVGLPEHASGSVLFADLSGFTPLTEALDRSLGPRRGGEELIRIVDGRNDALVRAVERFGGSVISFAGDSVTCWFDDADGPAPDRATSCALALAAGRPQRLELPGGAAPEQLSLKISIGSGPARRLVVGDPARQLLDTLIGPTLDRAVTGEHLADPDDVLLDEATLGALTRPVRVTAWRVDPDTGSRHAAVVDPAPDTAPDTAADTAAAGGTGALTPVLSREQLRPWILPVVFERHEAGLGDFLTELRPVVVVFLRFTGIDFTGPGVEGQLDGFVRTVQSTLQRTGGTLIDLTIGDKGSYLYAAFGAPVTHEDDARRAARAALEWVGATSAAGPHPQIAVQVGISRSVLRVGAHGGRSRRTYGAMGNEVNAAARLMMRAGAGEILLSGRIHDDLAAQFRTRPLPSVALKGISQPLPLFRLLGERSQPLVEPAAALPLVGRAAELELIAQLLGRTVAGSGQLVGVLAEAGLGKSRLLTEAADAAARTGMRVLRAQCESSGTNTAYLLWRGIWQSLLGVDPGAPAEDTARALSAAVDRWAPARLAAAPLLGMLLGVEVPDTPFTAALDAGTRASALQALVLDCLRAIALAGAVPAARDPALPATPGGGGAGGLLIVLDDLQWMDPVSHDLLELAARAVAGLPVAFLLAYRPPSRAALRGPRVEGLPHFTRIDLAPLAAVDATEMVRAKMAHPVRSAPAGSGERPDERAADPAPGLVARIVEHADGNPFYIEELLNYLDDRGIDPSDADAVADVELPPSLHTVVLARIDQLSSRQQAEIRLASVIGRLFPFRWLHALDRTGIPAAVLEADLAELAALDLTPLHTPAPALSHAFRHAVTQEVAHGSLPTRTGAALHRELADILVELGVDDLDLLAHHYSLGDDPASKRRYLQLAGTAAAARFANVAAVDYLSRALDLEPPSEIRGRLDLLRQRAAVLAVQADYRRESQDLEESSALADQLGDPGLLADVLLRGSKNAAETDDRPRAAALAERALGIARAGDLDALVARALFLQGWLARRGADYRGARALLEQVLVTAVGPGLRARCLAELAIMADIQGEHDRARTLFAEAVELHREAGDRVAEGGAVMNLGVAHWRAGDLDGAMAHYEQALLIAREVGDRSTEMMALANAGSIATDRRQFRQAIDFLDRALALSRLLGGAYSEARILNMLGLCAFVQGRFDEARSALAQSRAVATGSGDRQHVVVVLLNLARTARALGAWDDVERLCAEGLELSREIGEQEVSLLGTRLVAARRRGDDPLCGSILERIDPLLSDGTQDFRAGAAVDVGLVLSERGDLTAAELAFERAVELHTADGRVDLAAEPLAQLALLQLRRGAPDAARTAVTDLLDRSQALVDGEFQERFGPLRACWQVLSAAGLPVAGELRADAVEQLTRLAAGISDPVSRRQFLHDVPDHRALLEASGPAGSGRKEVVRTGGGGVKKE